jgi:hypothetical protein
MNEEQLTQLETTINALFADTDAAQQIRDLIASYRQLLIERDYAQQKLVEFKDTRAQQLVLLRNLAGL